MRLSLATNWWAVVLRGVLGVVLGLVSFAWPGVTLVALAFLFAAYALIDGVVSIIGAVRAMEGHERWGALVLEGIVGIGAAAVTIVWPPVTVLALVYIMAAWSIITGSLEIAAAIRLRRMISGEWLLILSGLASLLFGVLVILAPIAGALVLALWVGAYWLIFGVLLISFGFRMRSWERHGMADGRTPAHAH
jgi:uncharacterized membrane protein HdeD (DUF308 family)